MPAEDALTEEMVGRIADAAGGGLSLLDQVQALGAGEGPAGIDAAGRGWRYRAPGAACARLRRGAGRAVRRDRRPLAETVGEGLSLLDRLNRGGAGDWWK